MIITASVVKMEHVVVNRHNMLARATPFITFKRNTTTLVRALHRPSVSGERQSQAYLTIGSATERRQYEESYRAGRSKVRKPVK